MVHSLAMGLMGWGPLFGRCFRPLYKRGNSPILILQNSTPVVKQDTIDISTPVVKQDTIDISKEKEWNSKRKIARSGLAFFSLLPEAYIKMVFVHTEELVEKEDAFQLNSRPRTMLSLFVVREKAHHTESKRMWLGPTHLCGSLLLAAA